MAILQTREGMNSPAAPVETGQLELETLPLARQRSGDLPGNESGWMAHLTEDQDLLFRCSGQSWLGLMM